MIKIENVVTPSDEQWEAVVHGVRNPYASWEKSDGTWNQTLVWLDEDHQVVKKEEYYSVGDDNLKLMMKLSHAGDDHGKFLRMLPVICDITAPNYWLAELDTYKIATVRNSSSLQHTAMKKPYTIRNFSVPNEIQNILDPVREEKKYPLVYEYADESDYKIYAIADREYKVYSNGRVVRCAYECKHEGDNRIQNFQEMELKPTQNAEGYYYLNLGGHRYHERWLLHRLVASLWLKDTYSPELEINHKDGNKGNNCVSNLEWVTRQENTDHKFTYLGSGRDLHSDYLSWKKSKKYSEEIKADIKLMHLQGATHDDIINVYGISKDQLNYILYGKECENAELFKNALYWEKTIYKLNELRDLYLQTKDDAYFFLLRQIIPMSYNYRITWAANYQVLKNIYHSRKNHRLKEWEAFCAWISTLPLAEQLIVGAEEE